MKKIIAILIVIFTTQQIQAQEYEEVGNRVRQTTERSSDLKTVFKGESIIQGFGSLDFKATELKNSAAFMPGVQGGVIINRHLIIGLAAYGISNSISYQRFSDGQDLYLYGGYGGLLIGAVVAPNEIVHITFPLILGVGGIHSSDLNYFDIDQDFSSATDEMSTAILVVEPGAELEINITRSFRIGIGASYRFVQNSEIADVNNKSLSGLSGNFSLKFGNFR